jgi:hypothetical protein
MRFARTGGRLEYARIAQTRLRQRDVPAALNLAPIRTEVPPPGRTMSFPEWAEAIVAGVRRYLPDAWAVRKGARTVIIRRGEREAQLVDDGGAFVISFTAAIA